MRTDMNKTVLLLLFAASLSFAEIAYTVDIGRDGSSSIVLSMDEGETVEAALPSDAANFRIVGGSFETINRSAKVSTGKTGITTFSFSSNSLTAKTSTGWKLSFSPPEGSNVIILMPPYSTVESTDPGLRSISSEDSRMILELGYSEAISVNYRLEEVPQAEQEGFDSVYMLGSVILIAAFGILSFLLFRQMRILGETRKGAGMARTEGKLPTMELTRGKKEMMETFNENDVKIVNLLLSSEGKARRNELERKTGISKSSLAMALNRLEKRKIVEIDRTATTHFIRLSDYFQRL